MTDPNAQLVDTIARAIAAADLRAGKYDLNAPGVRAVYATRARAALAAMPQPQPIGYAAVPVLPGWPVVTSYPTIELAVDRAMLRPTDRLVALVPVEGAPA